jgi:hypothetical protein
MTAGAALARRHPMGINSLLPVKFHDSGSDAFSQIDKGVRTALIQAMQDGQQLAGF